MIVRAVLLCALCIAVVLSVVSTATGVDYWTFRERIVAYFLRRRMIRAGQNPDRILTRQERRHLEQRLSKQMRRAAYGSAKSHR